MHVINLSGFIFKQVAGHLPEKRSLSPFRHFPACVSSALQVRPADASLLQGEEPLFWNKVVLSLKKDNLNSQKD